MTLKCGFHPTPFEECFLAATERGICGLSFVTEGGHEEALEELRARWAMADVVQDAAATGPIAEGIFSDTPAAGGLHVHGTNFQIRVWEALLRVPEGALVSYSDLATAIGAPNAARAVGSAVARNPIAWLIPCHRVIRSTGVFGDYQWGRAKKKAILGWEAARRERARRTA